MKKYKNILLLVLIGFSLSSCYKEEYFLDDNVTSDGFHYPVIQLLSVDGNLTEGSSVNVMVQYFSNDPVKELVLYAIENGVESLKSTTPYVYSYDAEASAEIMTLNYTVAAGTSGTTVTLKVVVLTENGLSKEKTVKIDIL